MHTIGIDPKEMPRTKLLKGDLLFVEGNGSIEQIGRVALWTGLIEGCVHQNHLIKARFADQVVPKYALHFFCSRAGRDMIKEQAHSTSGLHTLNITKIQNLRLPLPPLAEQQAIVAAIESRLSVADQLEATLAQSLQQAEALRQSVLKQAFEGRLV
jgi:type I restriction enzyme, S subunit